MASDKDWIERRQRAAKCKIHGLHFDPRLTSGCVLCRKEGIGAAPREKPQMVVMLLSLLGIAVVLYRIFGLGDVTAASVSAAEMESDVVVASSTRLDAERYRSALQEVEKALFETPSADLGLMSDQIAGAISRLAQELARSTSPESRAAVEALDELAARVLAVPLDLVFLQELRRDWDALRRRHFGSALWFVRLATVDERTDRAALTTYRDVASDLYSILGESTDRAVAASTPLAPNATDAEFQARQLAEWQGYQSSWRQQLDGLKRRLPLRPDAASDPRVLLATQRLEQAFSQASALASAQGLPVPDRLEEALDYVERARQSFEDLLVQ